MTLFDGYVAIDWSAKANVDRKPKENSIFIATRGWRETPKPVYSATRQQAMDYIEMLLTAATNEGRRLLCGFDFAFGFPEGTARRMPNGRDSWEVVWERIAEVIKDCSDNRNNRYDAAAKLNACFNGDGPFWGNGRKCDIQNLPRKSPQVVWGVNLLPRLRYAECLVPKAKEVWKLIGDGQVGGQALTGIARLQCLRARRHDVQVWPFETFGDGRSHVVAEIYPSMINHCPMEGISTKDERQVRAVAAALQELDRTGELRQYLRAPLDMPARVRREEGAILGMHDPKGFEAARVAGSTLLLKPAAVSIIT